MNGLRIWARLRRYFLSGFFVLAPIGLSVFVLWWLVATVDERFAPPLEAALGWRLPGLGLLTAAVLILVVGFLASNVVGGKLLELVDEVFQRVPVLKWVYGTLRQVADAFSPESKNSFKSVVVVEYPRAGAYSLGFVTHQVELARPDGGTQSLLAVFVPTNQLYLGSTALFRKEDVIPTQLSVQQAIQATLSVGAALPAKLGKVSS